MSGQEPVKVLGGLRRRVANLFNRITGRKQPERPLPTQEEAQAVFDKYVPKYQSSVERTTEDLVAGRMTVKQYTDLLWNRIRDVYTVAAIAAAGGADNMTSKQKSALDFVLGKQYKYFVGFIAYLEKQEGEFKKGYIINRAMEYTKNARRLIEQVHIESMPRMPDMPFYPKDRTDCGQNCYCRWDIKTVDEGRGDYDCHWKLDPSKDNCGTCIERAKVCNPLQVRKGIITTPLKSTKLYTSRKG